MLTARKVIRVLHKAGFEEVRQKGSHVILSNPEVHVRIVVPVHAGKTIKKTSFGYNYT